MTLTCDAVLLDLDGVLIDSAAVVHRHWSRWAEQRGLDADQVVRTVHGRRPVDTVRLLAPDLDDPVAEAERLAAGEARDAEGLRVLPGAIALVASLPAGRWTVATSGPRELATFRLRFLGIPIPEAMVTAEDVDRGKPAPDPYRLAAQRLQCEPARCVVVEDTPAGIEAARAAGCRVIAVATTHAADQLREADAVVASLEQLTVRETGEGLAVAVAMP